MTKYRVTHDVVKAVGWQSWIVDAESLEDAKQKHKKGLSDFDDEEIEITGLSEEETWQELEDD